jgi:hypothetical protein
LNEQERVDLELLIENSVETRLKFQTPEFGAGPVELHSASVNVQMILTELETALSTAIRAKAKIDRQEVRVRLVWQEKFDRALTKKNVSFGSEFTSGKEKAAEANLASFEEARVLRKIQEDQSLANEAVEIIRLHYYGLDKARQDIRKRLDMSQTDYYS